MPDTRVVWVLLAVAAASALGGCLSPDGTDAPRAAAWADTWQADPCDPSGADEISGNAPVLDPYRGSPEEVARRFARALGEDLPPYQGTDNDGRWHTWSSDALSVRYEAGPSGALGQLRYTTPDVWPSDDTSEGRSVLRGFLDRFGVPDHVEVRIDRPMSRYEVHQVRDGTSLGGPVDVPTAWALPGDGSGQPGRWSAFELRLLHDVRGADATHPRDQARDTARDHMRCVMDREGRTAEDGWTLERVQVHDPAIRHESLAYVFQLDYDNPDPQAHCDRTVKLVHVDAETGAVLDDGIIGCD